MYISAKQIQWTWQELGEESFFVMLGGLHIKMAMLTMLGKWLVEAGIVKQCFLRLMQCRHINIFASFF